MKGTGKIWIFFDASTQRQTKPMSTLQAQVTLLNMKLTSTAHLFLWTPGWDNWKPLQKFLESEQNVFVVAPAPAPVQGPPPPPTHEDTITQVFHPENDEGTDAAYTRVNEETSSGKHPAPNESYGYFHDDFSAEKIDPEAKHSLKINLPKKKKVSSDDRRIETRHHFKIEVILVNKHGRSFRTFSSNISTGGTLLEDELPKDFLNSQFDLILVNKFERDPAKGRLHFQGKVVGDYVNPRRLMFLDSDDHTKKRLETLLRSYIEQQKALRKKSG